MKAIKANIRICENLIFENFPYPREFTTKDLGILLEQMGASNLSASGFCDKLEQARKIRIESLRMRGKQMRPTKYYVITEYCQLQDLGSPAKDNSETRRLAQGLIAQTVILAMGGKN